MVKIETIIEHNIELTTDFFDHDKKESLDLRDKIAASTVTDMIEFINKE